MTVPTSAAPARAIALVAALFATPDCDGSPGTPARDAATARDAARVGVRDASAVAAPQAVGPPVDPGAFPRFGCSTDAIPPHIVAGTATVTFRPDRGSPFSFRNLPARCGAACPGQLVEGARTRPGDGVEFVVCMPDERRLDVGFLRRGAVSPGALDVAHTADLVRLRIGLDRYVNVVSPSGVADPSARLAIGPRLRSATGSARLARGASGPGEASVEFAIACDTGGANPGAPRGTRTGTAQEPR
jgi:hypothetical protein